MLETEHPAIHPIQIRESTTAICLVKGETSVRGQEDTRANPEWSTSPSSHSEHLQGFHKSLRIKTILQCIKMVDQSDSLSSSPDTRILMFRTGATNLKIKPSGIRICIPAWIPHNQWITSTVGRTRLSEHHKMEDHITHNSVEEFPICHCPHPHILDSHLLCSIDQCWPIRDTFRILHSSRLQGHNMIPMFLRQTLMWNRIAKGISSFLF